MLVSVNMAMASVVKGKITGYSEIMINIFLQTENRH